MKTSWRCLEDVFARPLEDVLKTSWRRMAKMNILVLTKTSWRRLEDVRLRRTYSSWSRRLEDVLKTSSSRRLFAVIGLEAGCKSSKKITSYMFSPSHDRFWWCRFCSFALRLSEVFFDPVENYKMLMNYAELDNHWYSGEDLWQT